MIGVIYCIENTANGWCYIGSTLHEKERLAKHFRHLRKNKHFNKNLQYDFNLYGEDKFKIKIIHKNIPEHLLHHYEVAEINEARNDMIAVYNKDDATKRISKESRQKLQEKKLENKLARLNAYGPRQLTIPVLTCSSLDAWYSPKDCGDNSCVCIAPHQRIGMRTNAGCRCNENDLRQTLLSLKQFLIGKF